MRFESEFVVIMQQNGKEMNQRYVDVFYYRSNIAQLTSARVSGRNFVLFKKA